jgi:hypothetical protein
MGSRESSSSDEKEEEEPAASAAAAAASRIKAQKCPLDGMKFEIEFAFWSPLFTAPEFNSNYCVD